jgi:hypothetical protein
MALPAVAAGLQIFGTVMGVIGSITQGKAANASAKYNAAVAEQDRKRALETSRIAAEDKMRDNTRRLSTLRANMGSSGFELAGSPLAVLSDTSEEMSLDVRRIEQEGDVKSRDYFIQRQGYLAEGKNALNAGYIGAIGTAFSGGSSAAKTFMGA